MKFLIVFALVIVAALAAPLDDAKDAKITRLEQDDVRADGYSFAVETSDGFKHEQTGVLNNAGSDAESLAVKGSYSFVGDDGQTYTVDFVADENGFQPSGAHLPVAPVA